MGCCRNRLRSGDVSCGFFDVGVYWFSGDACFYALLSERISTSIPVRELKQRFFAGDKKYRLQTGTIDGGGYARKGLTPAEIFHHAHHDRFAPEICIFNIFHELPVVGAHAYAGHTHTIKNIGQKVLNLNNITSNKRFGSWIDRSFEMPYVSYCHPLCNILKKAH